MKEKVRKQITIKSRLILLEIISILGMIAISLVAIATSAEINDASTEIANFWIPGALEAEELNTNTSDYRIDEHTHVISQKREEMDVWEEQLAQRRKKIDDAFKDFSENYVSSELEAELINAARVLWSRYLVCSDEILSVSRENRTQEALDLLQGDSKRYFEEVSSILAEVADIKQTGAENASSHGDYLYRRLVETKVVMIVFLVFILSLLVASLIRGIAAPLDHLVSGINKVAAGKLDVELDCHGNNEMQVMARAVNNLSKKLNRMTMDEKRMLEEINNGHLDVKSEDESVYSGDFLVILYEIKNMAARMKAKKGSEDQKEKD